MARSVIGGTRGWDGLIVFLLPGIVWLAFRLPVMTAIGFTDAFYYFAYADNFHELVERYGFLYYAVRFGTIFPEWLAARALGPIAGFFVLRLALSGAVCWTLYQVFSRRASRLVGWLAASLWVLNPVVIGMMLSPYLTATAISLGFLGVLGFYALLAKAEPVGRWRRVAVGCLCGVLFACSSTSNLFAALIIASCMVGWIFCAGPLVFRLWREVLASLVGFAGTLALAAFYYAREYGMPLILNPTWDIIFSLNAGGAQQWAVPISEWIPDSPHNFAPLAALFISVIFLFRGGLTRALVGAWIAFAGFVGLYWFLDVFRGGYSLSFWIYFQFLMPGLTMLAAEYAASMRQRRSVGVWGGAPVAAACVGFLVFLIPSLSFREAAYWVLPGLVLFAAGLILAARVVSGSALGWMAVGGFIAISPVFTRSHLMTFSDSASLASAGAAISRMLPRISDDWREVKFWYPSSSASLRMVQSSQLFWFSVLRDRDQSAARFPEISDGLRDLWGDPSIGRLVVMDFAGSGGVDAALANLRASELPFRLDRSELVRADGGNLDVVVIEPMREIPDNFVAMDGLTFRARADAVVIPGQIPRLRTSTTLWSWDLLARLPELPGSGCLKVRIRVLRGRVGVMVYPGSDGPGTEATVPRSPEFVDVYLRVDSLTPKKQLVFRNAWVRGIACELEVQSVEWAAFTPD